MGAPSSTMADLKATEVPAEQAAQAAEEPAEGEGDEGSKIDWLRQRGVEIDLAEDREAERANPDPDKGFGSFEYVHLPADETAEPTICSAHVDNMDVLPRVLKRAFIDGGVASGVLQAQMGKHTGELPVSEASIERTLAEGCVESFCLARSSERNGFRTINMYLDEAGALKLLPLNTRAMQLARRCGFEPPPAVHGDVFVARVSTQPLVANTDFGRDELQPNAEWLASAPSDNMEAQAVQARELGLPEQGPAVDEEHVAEGYKWIQTDEDVELQVDVPVGTRAKSIDVNIKPKAVTVKVDKVELLTISTFLASISPDDSSWTVEPKSGVLTITMEKTSHLVWPTLCE